ncbi:hypothetical protein [Corallococcus macrosporus]|uniref:Uncharacterized protein n=2 Tax=Myxococcaceae TaxID=31 RepID=A0A286NVN2_9BACT|nr:hypothetical protein [Corallococcus macrosporus]AEI64003.1 hypothetical protein LILAB_10460 [Corallococcus macrosporus]ATB51227.1 hypothetical protein MYMAC_006885 [Corallococcus macrosporus DSM 14697]
MSGLVCQENVGFLFSHGCGSPAAMTCMRCAMPLCEQHMTPVGAEMLCARCAREHEDSTGDRGAVDEDDPSYYYEDYGYYGAATSGHGRAHDANDFTEADGESLRREDDASFEEDMGGS